jgi:hypothetical protein
MIDVVRDEVVPATIRAAMVTALFLVLWIVLVIGGSLITLVAYAAVKAPVLLWLYEHMALAALAPIMAYGLFRLVEFGTKPRTA